MKAQAKILAKAESDAAGSADAAALEFAQAEVAAAAAKERRGNCNKGDGTMSGGDLAAAVKFVHLKKSAKGWSKYDTKGKRVQFLGALSPAWTEVLVCDASTATPVVAAAAAEPTLVNYAAIATAERRAQLAVLTAAMEGVGRGDKGHDGLFCVFRPHSWHITWYSYSTREDP